VPISDFVQQVNAVIKRDDIRGVFGANIDQEFAYNLGLALAEVVLDCTAVPPANVVVGHDMRVSGPLLADGLCTGLADAGCRPIRLGQAGTELVGFLPAKYSDVIDAGVIITASHNPREYNGFKFFGRAGLPITMLRQSAPPEPQDELQRIALAIKKRSIPDRLAWADFAPDYIRTALDRGGCDFDRACASCPEPMRVAVEAGNGMGGRIIGEFARLRPYIEWTFSNETPDGTFPIIVPNPLQAAYQKMVADLVLRSESNVGICFDGDADRVAVADEKGLMLSPPQLTALVGQRLREKLGPDIKVAFNLATSWAVPDTLGDRSRVLDGAAVMTPVGYGKIKPIMFADPQIAFGAEHSGHYMFRDFWCSDSGMLAGLLMLELTAELLGRGKTLSSAIEGLRRRYCGSGEINFQLPPDRPGRQVIEEAAHAFGSEVERIYVVSEGRVHEVEKYPPDDLELEVNDVRAEGRNWWFCMRTSGTEAGAGDLLRLYVEAFEDGALMERKRDAIVEMVGPSLRV